jgi:flagellar FliL protein
MADEDAFMEEDVAGTGDVEVGQKIGFLPAVAIKILKWAVIGLAAIAFIVTVVVVTMRILNRGTSSATLPAVSQEYTSKPPILQPFDNFEDIRTRTADETPYTVVARVALGYKMGDKNLQSELVQRTRMLQDMIRGFFSQKTANQLDPRNEQALKEELRAKINAVLTAGKVEEVWFLELNVIPL